MPVTKLQANKPVKGKIFEYTYNEVVTVNDGVAVCKTQTAAKALEVRGYQVVPEAPPEKKKKKEKKPAGKSEKKEK